MIPYFKNIANQIANNSSGDEKILISLLNKEAMNYYPKYLYKYRSCDKEHNFEIIEQEYLWLDYPTSFDDPVDAAVNLKLRTEFKDIERWIYQHSGEILYYNIEPKGMAKSKHGQTLAKYKDAQAHYFDEYGNLSAKSIASAMRTEINKLSHQDREKAIKTYRELESPEFQKKVEDAVRKELSDIVNSLRDKTLLVGLTARKDNQKMWEDYSNKYTGFVIEYKRPDYELLSDDQKLMIVNLLPVSYYKRIPGVPLLPFIKYSFEKNLYGKTPDISDAMNTLFCQMLYKKYEYNYEQEWRLFANKTEHKMPFPFISAVYAGYKISDSDLNRLKGICQKKNIPLYKQEYNVTGKMDFQTIWEGNNNE